MLYSAEIEILIVFRNYANHFRKHYGHKSDASSFGANASERTAIYSSST